jgi:hypothetical protein
MTGAPPSLPPLPANDIGGPEVPWGDLPSQTTYAPLPQQPPPATEPEPVPSPPNRVPVNWAYNEDQLQRDADHLDEVADAHDAKAEAARKASEKNRERDTANAWQDYAEEVEGRASGAEANASEAEASGAPDAAEKRHRAKEMREAANAAGKYADAVEQYVPAVEDSIAIEEHNARVARWKASQIRVFIRMMLGLWGHLSSAEKEELWNEAGWIAYEMEKRSSRSVATESGGSGGEEPVDPSESPAPGGLEGKPVTSGTPSSTSSTPAGGSSGGPGPGPDSGAGETTTEDPCEEECGRCGCECPKSDGAPDAPKSDGDTPPPGNPSPKDGDGGTADPPSGPGDPPPPTGDEPPDPLKGTGLGGGMPKDPGRSVSTAAGGWAGASSPAGLPGGEDGPAAEAPVPPHGSAGSGTAPSSPPAPTPSPPDRAAAGFSPHPQPTGSSALRPIPKEAPGGVPTGAPEGLWRWFAAEVYWLLSATSIPFDSLSDIEKWIYLELEDLRSYDGLVSSPGAPPGLRPTDLARLWRRFLLLLSRLRAPELLDPLAEPVSIEALLAGPMPELDLDRRRSDPTVRISGPPRPLPDGPSLGETLAGAIDDPWALAWEFVDAAREDWTLIVDIVGLLPIEVVQEIADIVSGVISLYRGDTGLALLSFASAAPVLGQVPGAVKLLVKLEKVLTTSTRALRRLRALAAALRSWLGRALGLTRDALERWLLGVGDNLMSLASAVAERLGVAPEVVEIATRQARESADQILESLGIPRRGELQLEPVRIDGRRGRYPSATEEIDGVEIEWREQSSRYADPADLDGPSTGGGGGGGSGGGTSSGGPKKPFDWKHVLDGDETGFHSRPGGVDPPNARVISKGSPDGAGVYEAKVRITDPNTGVVTTKKSTFFPDEWSHDRVKFEVEGAYGSRVYGDPAKPNKWTGISPSGVRIEGYDGPTRTTAYPVRYGRR